ncbi:MAG TPA: class II aldolase/adducin family protein [Casimicrobiaceae bacterium]|nr:class II aldolase/adducin family protein [Casimicrobiaceae bacterium]
MAGRTSGPRSSAHRALRAAIIATARAMNAHGINRGKSGNVSARTPGARYDGFLITPTGMPYDTMRPRDIVAVSPRGEAHGARLPSSEWRFHHDLYRVRDDLRAIVHAHSPFATALACLRRGIPAFHYMVAVAGGRDIRCAPYRTFGTQALADRVVEAMEGRRACLLANHGMLAGGASLAEALALAVEVETLAEMYWRALQLGEPALLSAREMEKILVRFRTYGQPR